MFNNVVSWFPQFNWPTYFIEVLSILYLVYIQTVRFVAVSNQTIFPYTSEERTVDYMPCDACLGYDKKSFDNSVVIYSVKARNILVGLCKWETLSISMKTVMSFLRLIWTLSSGDRDHFLFCVCVCVCVCMYVSVCVWCILR
jgi:hypothetical protein